ncbi:hypothetical protein Tco_1531769 [Tanacetum coccineum]
MRVVLACDCASLQVPNDQSIKKSPKRYRISREVAKIHSRDLQRTVQIQMCITVSKAGSKLARDKRCLSKKRHSPSLIGPIPKEECHVRTRKAQWNVGFCAKTLTKEGTIAIHKRKNTGKS